MAGFRSIACTYVERGLRRSSIRVFAWRTRNRDITDLRFGIGSSGAYVSVQVYQGAIVDRSAVERKALQPDRS